MKLWYQSIVVFLLRVATVTMVKTITFNTIENGKEDLIPVAAGIGGEVVNACSECQKIMSKFLLMCVDQEIHGVTPTTFRGFCEGLRGRNLLNLSTELCLVLNEKLANVAGEKGTELVDPTKAPALCIKYKNECDRLGGAPECFSGFCENIVECVDCPTAVVDKLKNGTWEPEICGASGICRLGWKNPNAKGGNAYCECTNGMRGLACNQF